MSKMDFADTFLDRRMFSTDTNEYATGLLDENAWEENIIDSDTPLDGYIDDMMNGIQLHNEVGFDRERIF